MTDHENDDEALDRYLRGESELSRLYRQSADEQPPPEIDAAILARARRDADRPRRTPAGPFARRWTLPVSLAAVVVLSVSLVLLMQEPDIAPIAEPGADAGSAPAPSARGSGLDSGEGEGEARQARPASKAAPAERKKERANGLRQAPEDAFAPAPTPGRAGARSAEPEAPAAPRPSEESVPMAHDTPAAAAVAPARDEAPAAVRADPRAWLGFVDTLAERGDEDGALRELEAFRDRYPDYPLPPRLRELAEQRAR